MWILLGSVSLALFIACGILLQLLAAFGNVIGPGPHCMVGATRHTLNLFVVLVGESSKARKDCVLG